MIIILGLIILIAAVVAGVAGVMGNGGSAHALTHGFSALGYHVHGSTGTLFLFGIVVGAAGVLGLGLLLAGARRTSRRGGAARQKLRQSRRETAAVSKDRDDLIEQRRIALTQTAVTPENGAARAHRDLGPADGRQGRPRWFRRQSATRQAPAAQSRWPNSQPAADIPAETPVPAE